MKKTLLISLCLCILMLLTSCAPPVSDRYDDLPITIPFGENAPQKHTESTLTAIFEPTPAPTPVSTEPVQVYDPNAMDDDVKQWPLFALFKWTDYSIHSNQYIEQEVKARKITTPTFEYTYYLPENCKYKEDEYGVTVSYRGSNQTMTDEVMGVIITSYPAGTDIEPLFRDSLPGQANEFDYVDDSPQSPALSRVFYGKPLPGYIERASIWYVLAKANPHGTRIVVAKTYFPYSHPVVAKNMLWVAETFRCP